MENLEFTLEIKEFVIRKLLKEKTMIKYKVKEELGITEDNRPLNNYFEKEFKDLLKDKVVIKINKNTYASNLPKNYAIGKIYFNPQGNGFLVDELSGMTYFVYRENILNALYGDTVILAETKKPINGKKPEGKVVSVIKRDLTKVIGTYMEYNGNIHFVLPDNTRINRDIYIPEGASLNANPYDKVVVKINKYPQYKETNGKIEVFNPEGTVIEVLGMTGDKGVDSLSVIKANDIREEFSAEVLREANEIPTIISDYDIDGRLDLRNDIIFTIDGEDAKDLDDAISIQKLDDNTYELGVHIADVSHYVKESSSIDKEALLRGTSVYLIDKVIPMLPKILSNGVCSLNPFEDKLTLSCIMKINKDGEVIKAKVQESIISSKARLNYKEVTDFLESGTPSFVEKYSEEVSNSLLIGEELALILREKRERRGSIEFDTVESKFTLDENGKVIEIHPYERGISNDMIEEFMLVANETIAKKFADLKIPFVYRIHDYPRAERLELFDRIAKNYGFEICLGGEKHVEPKVIQQFLEDNKDREEIIALKELLLHSMQQARYSSTCGMHFGLASNYYCHFTSPIRRYPDLQIHRIIKKSLHGEINNVTKAKYEKITEEVAEHCSRTERNADEAERDLDKQKMYEYIVDHHEEIFEGYIRNFNKKGMFVTLDNSAEGFIKTMNFEFDENTYQGKIGEDIYKLGDRVKVKMRTANRNAKEIIFDIIKEEN